MRSVIKSLELSNNLILPYVEQGDPSGVPLLLLHGVTDSWYSFERVLPHLPSSIHAFALTQRGHGDASRPLTGYFFHDFAADVAAFMDALNIEKAIIAGHSMGGSVAQRFAIDYPDRTLGIVLMGAFASLRSNPGVQELWVSTISTMTDPIDPNFVREFQQSTLAQQVPPAYFETVVQESLKVPAFVWRETFKGFLEEDFLGDLGSIKVPTLIVWGDRDIFSPLSDQQTLATQIKRSRLVVYAGAGHALHWEEPERFASDLVAFTQSIVK